MYCFAENLKELINEKDKSLRKIASECGIRSGQLSEYLHGSYPTVERAIELANYFDCSLDYLFGLSEKRNHDIYTNEPFSLTVFIQRYEDLLKRNKTTHWQFTRHSELAESTLRHWRAGHKPLLDSLVIIACGLDASIDYLVGRWNQTK